MNGLRLLLTTLEFGVALIAFSQRSIAGNCDYPSQMELDRPYVFELQSDSSKQMVTVTATGERKLKYEILLERRDTLPMSGRINDRVIGAAVWNGCFGGVTSDDIMRLDSWEYVSADGLLTITLFGEYVTHIQLNLAPISTNAIPRVGY